jgi:hypothetical protein
MGASAQIAGTAESILETAEWFFRHCAFNRFHFQKHTLKSIKPRVALKTLG